MLEWFSQQQAQGTPLSGPICMTKARFFYDALGLEGDFDASSGWFTCLKHRQGFRDVTVKGELLSRVGIRNLLRSSFGTLKNL